MPEVRKPVPQRSYLPAPGLGQPRAWLWLRLPGLGLCQLHCLLLTSVHTCTRTHKGQSLRGGSIHVFALHSSEQKDSAGDGNFGESGGNSD